MEDKRGKAAGGVGGKAKLFDMKQFKKGLIVVLENAYLEAAKVGQEYQLLNCDDHISFLKRKGRDPSQARPDIAHQCLMTLLDSPLNKAGLLKIYVHTVTNVLIDVNPKLRIPRTFKRFAGLMVQLLHTRAIKAEGRRGEAVLKLMKNPVTQYFPANTTVIGTSYSCANLVDIFDFVPKLFTQDEKIKEEEDSNEPALKRVKVEREEEGEEIAFGSRNTNGQKEEEKEEENEEEEEGSGSDSDEEEEEEEGEKEEEEQVDEPPQDFSVKEEGVAFTSGKNVQDKLVCIVVGAMSHGKVSVDYVQDEISISQYPLSGSVACGKICASFEKFFGVI